MQLNDIFDEPETNNQKPVQRITRSVSGSSKSPTKLKSSFAVEQQEPQGEVPNMGEQQLNIADWTSELKELVEEHKERTAKRLDRLKAASLRIQGIMEMDAFATEDDDTSSAQRNEEWNSSITTLKKSNEIQALACKLESGVEFMQNLQKHLEIVEQPLQWAKDNKENIQKGLQSASNKINDIMSTLDANNESLQDSIDKTKKNSNKMNPELNAFSKQLKEIRQGFVLGPCKKRNRENEDNISSTLKNNFEENSSSPSKKRRKVTTTKSPNKRSHSLPQLDHQQDGQAERKFQVHSAHAQRIGQYFC
jgi:chromosome segregation ATPase